MKLLNLINKWEEHKLLNPINNHINLSVCGETELVEMEVGETKSKIKLKLLLWQPSSMDGDHLISVCEGEAGFRGNRRQV